MGVPEREEFEEFKSLFLRRLGDETIEEPYEAYQHLLYNQEKPYTAY